MTQFNRLTNRDPAQQLPQYAGKRVRCASVIMETAGRKPLGIRDIRYSIIFFDNNGRIDTARGEKEIRLVGERITFPDEEHRSVRIIDAKQRFLKRQYAHESK